MHAATDRLEFAPPPTPGLVRALALAFLAHAVLLAGLTWGVHWKRESTSITVEAELWSALPQTAAPKPVQARPPPPPAPVAPPRPAPLQPALPDADIVLAQEKLRLKKEEQAQRERDQEQQRLTQQRLDKLKQEQLLEKKRLQEQAEEKKKSELVLKRQEELKAQQEAKKIETMRQENMQRMSGLAGATGAPGATGNARQASGPSAGYAGRIRARIKPNIVFTDDIAGNPTAEVEVRTAPDGTIISRKLTKTSGVASWDEAVLKAIDKTEVLPRDLDGRVPPVLEFSFRPKD